MDVLLNAFVYKLSIREKILILWLKTKKPPRNNIFAFALSDCLRCTYWTFSLNPLPLNKYMHLFWIIAQFLVSV